MVLYYWTSNDAAAGDPVLQRVRIKKAITTGLPENPKNVFCAFQELNPDKRLPVFIPVWDVFAI
jgi:hypothetical protein